MTEDIVVRQAKIMLQFGDAAPTQVLYEFELETHGTRPSTLIDSGSEWEHRIRLADVVRALEAAGLQWREVVQAAAAANKTYVKVNENE